MAMTRHYLDHASTSPPRPEVIDAMVTWWDRARVEPIGDPARIHAEGMTARVEIEQGRAQVAAAFGARSREVVFTSGATESIAMALWGAAERGTQLIVPTVEHSAVRLSAAALADAGTHQIVAIGTDGLGRIAPQDIFDAVTAGTALVSIQWANHEVGTRQPVAEVVAGCRERGVLVHIDAAAGAGHDEIDFGGLGADLLSLSAHKFGGPPGIGVLLIRRGLRLRSLLRGGDQERARRGGFENGPAIAGLAAACAFIGDGGAGAGAGSGEAERARRLTDRILAAVPDLDGVRVYGDPVGRVAHIVCLGIDGIEPQAVLLGLDRDGIAAHSGSACSSEALEPSPVLQAMGVDAHRSLRLSVGWNTTDADIDALLASLPVVVADLRALSGAHTRPKFV
jgi:cysteine desulfurase